MKNPFSPDVQGEMKLNRNVYDLGRNSVFTTDFFKLYPFFLQEVIPGDSVQLDAQVGIRGMPTVFPVQTRCRISMEYYYVRNRTLMDNFEDFIFKTKDVEHPWLRLNEQRAQKMISIGSLGDAFNVPSSFGVGSDLREIVPLSFGFVNSEFITQGIMYESASFAEYGSNFSSSFDILTQFNPRGTNFHLDSINLPLTEDVVGVGYLFNLKPYFFDNLEDGKSFYSSETIVGHNIGAGASAIGIFLNDNDIALGTPIHITLNPVRITDTLYRVKYTFESRDFEILPTYKKLLFFSPLGVIQDDIFSSPNFKPEYNNVYFPVLGFSTSFKPEFVLFDVYNEEIIDSTDSRFIYNNPFVGSFPKIRLNALPFRAYEQVCNYYYRNDKNNPYVLNGEAQYNEFIPTHGDGPDDNVYDFHYRNWELDRFTSAVQSPQFGEAPLVGLTYSPTAETATLEFDGTNVETGESRSYSVKVGVDGDGNIDSIVDFDKDIPSANLRRLSDSINAGISINDLRITNSFQRFLENVLRRGLRYRNQLKSHFGTSVDYPDIDVPQYIGGASSYLDSGQVTNMADSPNAGLGDYVGTLQGGISTRNKIHCYCPEHGWIIGIMSIAPIPSYPQSINKSLIKSDAFDYFLPEFGKIGYVPIHYSELMPLQTGEGQSVDDVFGYQKAWYDYMQAMDEVHGDFRTTLRDFVLTRTFKERPQLSESFTVGSPEQLNDIFVANNIADKYGSSAKFMCSSHVSCIMKRPIPMIGTPSLE